MPSTPPRAVAVEAAASRPTDADNAAISRLSQAAGRDLPPVAYLVKIQLETVPEAMSRGWARYVGNFRIPKYWEYKDGIYGGYTHPAAPHQPAAPSACPGRPPRSAPISPVPGG
jgi:hypothetical protein